MSFEGAQLRSPAASAALASRCALDKPKGFCVELVDVSTPSSSSHKRPRVCWALPSLAPSMHLITRARTHACARARVTSSAWTPRHRSRVPCWRASQAGARPGTRAPLPALGCPARVRACIDVYAHTCTMCVQARAPLPSRGCACSVRACVCARATHAYNHQEGLRSVVRPPPH